jgi:hypothetical protein
MIDHNFNLVLWLIDYLNTATKRSHGARQENFNNLADNTQVRLLLQRLFKSIEQNKKY